MSLLSYTELCELVERGVIEHSDFKNVNPGSINVTLQGRFLLESGSGRTLEFSKRESPTFRECHDHVFLAPGAFCLGALVERVNLPNDLACDVMLRSSAARMGIQHLLAGYGDQGFSGHLTLELRNELSEHNIILRGGDQIVQLRFHRTLPVPDGHCYISKGAKYAGDTGPQPIKKEHSQ